MNWLMLILSLPTENATERMRAWRMLKASGATALRDGVYLMPATSGRHAALHRVEQDVADSGGTAYLLEVEPTVDYPFADLFDRTVDYQKLATKIEDCDARLESSPVADLTREARKLRKALNDIVAIDFFPADAQRQVVAMLEGLESRLASMLSPDEPTGLRGTIQHRNPSDFRGRLWATRKNLWVDRVASAWLIRRFIDPGARFLWLDSPDDCPPDALGFDFDGATFTHVETSNGSYVTFETLAASFGLQQDVALEHLARVVHALDVGGLPVAEAAGLEMLLRGIKARTRDDDLLLAEAGRLLDDMYLAFQSEHATV
jgi:hypothetical protein